MTRAPNLPIEVAARMAVIEGWMDRAKFIALKSAVDHRIFGRNER